MVTELAENCAEKPKRHIEVGVNVAYDKPRKEYQIKIGDNVNYGPKELADTLVNLESMHPLSGEKTAKRKAKGGVGLESTRLFLKAWRGSLAYEATLDHTIDTQVTIPRDGFLHHKRTDPLYLYKNIKG